MAKDTEYSCHTDRKEKHDISGNYVHLSLLFPELVFTNWGFHPPGCTENSGGGLCSLNLALYGQGFAAGSGNLLEFFPAEFRLML